MLPLDDEPRPHCYRCDKPQSMCVCEAVPRVDNQVGVHILQHARERRHSIGTARLLKLGLKAVDVHVLHYWSTSAACDPIAFPPGAGLLYPGDNARDLGTLPPDERPKHLVVIDGTWAHAHRIYRDNPWIQAMPHFSLTPTEASRYRIRNEPRAECLSTLEAVVQALRLVEPTLEGTEGLLEAFDAMIDDQIAAQDRAGSNVRVVKKPRRNQPLLAPGLLRPPGDVIVVFAEAAPRQPTGQAHNPLRLSALTLDGAQPFDAVIDTVVPPDSYLLERLGLTEADLDGSQPISQVTAAFEAYCAAGRDGRGVTLVAWSPWTLRWLQARFPLADHVLLKSEWANRAPGQTPGVVDVVQGLGLSPTAVSIPGRSGERLGHAHALAQHLVATAEP